TLTPRDARRSLRLVRQREHRQHTAELRVAAQALVRTEGTQALRRAFEAGRHADAGPAADTGQHADVLLAIVHPRVDVTDDSGRRLEAIELVARLGVHRLQIPLERPVEHDAAGRRERTAPDRERLRYR